MDITLRDVVGRLITTRALLEMAAEDLMCLDAANREKLLEIAADVKEIQHNLDNA